MNAMSVEEVCEFLEKSKQTIALYIKNGKLEPVYVHHGKVGRPERRISLASVAMYIKEKS